MPSSSAPIDWTPMIIGFIAGLVSRLWSLRSGRDHFPGYPSGYVSQVALATIAAMIGSSILTALEGKEFTAATFLTLAATQFRDVRNTERRTLESEENLILVPRGAGYIEGIAVTYEARNYLAMLVALVTSAGVQLFGALIGIAIGILALIVSEIMMSGPTVGEVIDVRPAKIHFEKGSLLYAGAVMLMEVGLPHTRQRWLDDGLGVELLPKNRRGQVVLWNVAQRAAITHSAAAAVGVQKDVGYPDQMPLCRMELPTPSGNAGLGILPIDRDMDRLIEAIRHTPVLESGKWSPMRNTVKHREKSSESQI